MRVNEFKVHERYIDEGDSQRRRAREEEYRMRRMREEEEAQRVRQ